MITADYHMHTSFSVDCETSMEDMVLSCIKKSLKQVAFTDHVDYFIDGSPYEYQINYDEYLKEFNRLKDKYADLITLKLGVELGAEPEIYKQLNHFTKQYPFDFIIMSTHQLNGKDVYFDNYITKNNLPKNEALELYFGNVLKNIGLVEDFCVYGHLDYIMRYTNYDDNSIKYAEYKSLIDPILKALIEKGKGLEINTSGYRYNLNQFHPHVDILKKYKELGGEIITIGSDSHAVQFCGEHFDVAREMLVECGFKYRCEFDLLKPKFVLL